jgi:choline transport protein
MLGFASTCIASWEGILTYLGFVLLDGGTALLFWGFIACAIGQTAVYASLAEMASISPTAGGQYHVRIDPNSSPSILHTDPPILVGV